MQANNQNAKPFLDEDFLLQNKMARVLYHDYAKKQPIIDYHNHLPPDEIAGDKHYDNITQAWLYGDHYKWRAMRTLGIDERYITGKATDKEKFLKWAETVPFTIRNPLFQWTHLELKRYFGIEEILRPESAERIYEACNERLQQKDYGAQGLLAKMKVETVCTTDDPADRLEYHRAHQKNDTGIKMYPAFRPDKAILIGKDTYNDYIDRLAKAADTDIETYPELLQALKKQIDFFHEQGCRISDHGLNKLYARPFTERQMDDIFRKKRNGQEPSAKEQAVFTAGLMHELGKCYAQKGWVMQLHLGALRNNSSRMLNKLGPDTGFDSIGDYAQAEDLSGFLNELDKEDKLPKTIIYNLNPRDNAVMATMIGNFNDGKIRGKMQFGSAWWFLDQKDGMEKQMNALSNMGLLSCFVGMLTDSRSFLSFPRHEYFRRILCNLIGKDVHNGELPYDEAWLGGIVKDICYHNARDYFQF
ncbi:MAG TPA: glucuronate isomerase [Saprospiraceae bacterium]|nr:glucuronate isomerase [Saprospiraceae bacterium]